MITFTACGEELALDPRWTDGTVNFIVELEHDHVGSYWGLRLNNAGGVGRRSLLAHTRAHYESERDDLVRLAKAKFKTKRVHVL